MDRPELTKPSHGHVGGDAFMQGPAIECGGVGTGHGHPILIS